MEAGLISAPRISETVNSVLQNRDNNSTCLVGMIRLFDDQA